MKLKKILKAVSEGTGLPVEVIKAKNRKRELVQARNIYYLLARKQTNESLDKIGKLVNVDHATVYTGLKRFENDIETNYLNSKKLVKLCKERLIELPTCANTESIEIKDPDLIEMLNNRRIDYYDKWIKKIKSD